MNRQELENIFGSGDGISTAQAAEIWDCTKATARRRLNKMPDMVGTNTNITRPGQKVGKVDGKYVDEIWQLCGYEEDATMKAALDAFFPPDRDTMGYHIAQTYPDWKMLRDRPDGKISALDGPLGICTCHHDGSDWVLSVLVDGKWQTHTILSTDDVARIVRESR